MTESSIDNFEEKLDNFFSFNYLGARWALKVLTDCNPELIF